MVVIVDDTGGTDVGGGGLPEQEDAYTYLGGEETVHSFDLEHVESAMRFSYESIPSGVVFTILAGKEAQKSPGLIKTVAGQMSHAWNLNVAVPGVVDVAETQEVRPLGSLDDVYQIAVESTNGKTGGVLTIDSVDIRPDVFAQLVAAYRATLDQFG